MNAITYLQTRSDIDENRIGVFGSGGTGGGNASYVASLDERVLCTVCIHSVGDGEEWLHSMRREYEWVKFLDKIKENREKRVLTGEDVLVDPREEITIATPERRRTTVKADVDSKIPNKIPFRSAEAIMKYKPVDFVHKISPRAIMWICLENDDVTPASQSIRMYEKAKQPKKLLLLKGTSHYESYGKFFDQIMPEILDWYGEHLKYNYMDSLKET
jgi:cephalosporin-C deacetylase-like acetyl esterase